MLIKDTVHTPILLDPPTDQDIIQMTYDILEDPIRWTQHSEARNKSGKFRVFLDPDITCLCLGGAIAYAARALNADHEVTYKAEKRIMKSISQELDIDGDIPEPLQGYKDVKNVCAIYNDRPERTHEEIVTLLKNTLEAQQ